MWYAGSKELVWRGIASEMLASNPEKSEKRINKVVRKLFKKFPPSADSPEPSHGTLINWRRE